MFLPLIRTEYGKEINEEYDKASIGKSSMQNIFSLISKNKAKEIISYYEKLYKEKRVINQNMVSLIKDSKKKYSIICATNTNELHFRANKEIIRIFDSSFPSFKLGYKKENPEFFRIMLKKLKLKPEETLLIDNFEKNINIAKSLGMKSIKFEGYDKLIKSPFLKLKWK